MSTTVTDTAMTSDETGHTAHKRDSSDLWSVSWMPPHRLLGRNQATTAMVLAEWVANYWVDRQPMGIDPRRFRTFANEWAGELGLSREEAIELISGGPAVDEHEGLLAETGGHLAECESCGEPVDASAGYGALCDSCEQDDN